MQSRTTIVRFSSFGTVRTIVRKCAVGLLFNCIALGLDNEYLASYSYVVPMGYTGNSMQCPDEAIHRYSLEAAWVANKPGNADNEGIRLARATGAIIKAIKSRNGQVIIRIK